MLIDPRLAELRRDPAPQRRAQAALEAARDGWRAEPAVCALLGELDRYGAGACLGDCPRLENALADLSDARALVEPLVARLVSGLAAHPLGHAPLRHQYAQGLAVMQLAQAGRAALSLVCYEARPANCDIATTVCFAGGERRELCLAGGAEARFFEVLREEPGRADLDCESRRLTSGDALAFAGARHTKLVDRPQGRLALLRLSRTEAAPLPAREYRIADGALVHCASGDRAESRDEMAAAVLGAMGRGDAAPVLAGIVNASASSHLRWRMLCEALALDTAIGFAALSGIAADLEDDLASYAGALRASLVERHPELTKVALPCRC